MASIEETQVFGTHASAMLTSAHMALQAVMEMVGHDRDEIALIDRTSGEMCDNALHLVTVLDQQLLALQRHVSEIALGK